MKKILLFVIVLILLISCDKDNKYFVANQYDYSTIRLDESTVTYDYTGNIVSSDFQLNTDLLLEDFNHSYFMKRIDLVSGDLSKFYFIVEDSIEKIINVSYTKIGDEIKFEPRTNEIAIDSSLIFLDNDINLEAECIGLRFVHNSDDFKTYLTTKSFGTLSDEIFNRFIDLLGTNDTLYLQKFKIIYERK